MLLHLLLFVIDHPPPRSFQLPDVPLYYTLPALCASVHVTSPPLTLFKGAIAHVTNPATGRPYRVSSSHRLAEALKTDAPPSVLYDILRCWARRHPVAASRRKPGSACDKILSREPAFEADFSVPAWLAAQWAAAPKASRHPPNPEAHWGPKARAAGTSALNTHGGGGSVEGAGQGLYEGGKAQLSGSQVQY